MTAYPHDIGNSIAFKCDFRPMAWQRARRKGDHYYNSDELTAFKKAVGFIANTAMGNKPLMTGPVRMDIYATFTPPKSTAKKRLPEIYGKPFTSRSDFDNHIKAISDALNGVVYKDDRQVAHGSIERWYGPQDGFRVTITRLEG